MIRTFLLGAVASAVIVASPAAADSAGLVGYWKLDEGQGQRTADSSGLGNSATVDGNAAWVPGHTGSALGFDGSGRGWVNVPDSSSLEPTSAVTVAAWVNESGSPGMYRYIVAKGAAGCIAASYGLYSARSGGLEFYVATGHGSVYADSPDAGNGVWDGRWHFVVGTYDGATARLFVDGAQVGTGTRWDSPLQYTLSDSNELFIGNYPGCPSQNFAFRGTIDEVSVWDRALSAAEITAYAANPSPIVPSPAGVPPTGGPPPPPPTSPTDQAAPRLVFLNLLPAMFRLRADSQHSGTTISYLAAEADVATLTVLRALPGAVKHGRCVKPAAVRSGGHRRSCTRFVAVGAFSHLDRVGRNRFHFGGLAGRKLLPGQYRLAVTPRAHHQTGQTVTATFWVLR